MAGKAKQEARDQAGLAAYNVRKAKEAGEAAQIESVRRQVEDVKLSGENLGASRMEDGKKSGSQLDDVGMTEGKSSGK